MSPRALVPLLLLFAVAGGIALYSLGGDETRGSSSRPERAALEPTNEDLADLAPAAGPTTEGTGATDRDERRAVDAPIPALAVHAPTEEAADARQVGALLGRVVDVQGRPVAGAKVRGASSIFTLRIAEQMEGEPVRLGGDVAEATTDAEGRFVLEDVPPGEPLLSVRAAGFAPGSFEHLTVAAAERKELVEDLVLDASAVLEGVVLDRDGVPVEGARVHARPKQDPGFGFVVSNRGGLRTDAQGRFRLDQLPRERLELIVDHADHARHEEALDAREARILPSLEVRLATGLALSGRVTELPADEASELVVVAQPSSVDFGSGFQSRHADVAADGTFRLQGLKEGSTWTLQAIRRGNEAEGLGMLWPTSDNRVTDQVVATAGERDLLLPWLGAVAVLATVVDAATGEPIEELEVEHGFGWFRNLRGDDGGEIERFPGGVVRIEGLRPEADGEAFQLKIDAAGYERWERDDLRLVPGVDLDLGEIALAPLPQVRVTVLDASSGEPIEGAKVSLRIAPEPVVPGGETVDVRSMSISIGGDDDGEALEGIDFDRGPETRRAESDADGVAVLDAFEGEVCELVVRAKGFAPVKVGDWELPEGRVATRTVELAEGGGVTVLAVDRTGSPLAGRRVEHREPFRDPSGPEVFLPGGGARGSLVTDEDGRAVFENLAPGEHRFRLAKPKRGGGGGMVFVQRLGGPDGEDESWTAAQVAQGEHAELTLTELPTATLTGRVTERGEPLARATVSLKKRRRSAPGASIDAAAALELADLDLGMFGGGNSARTDRKGHFTLEGLDAGDYTLSVRHADRAMPYEVDLTLGTSEVRRDVDLPVAILAGRVVDPEGRGVGGIAVAAERARVEGGEDRQVVQASFVVTDGAGGIFGSGIGGANETKTDVEGYFELRGVQGDVDLQVVASGAGLGWQEGRSEVVRVAPDERVDGVDLTVEPAGSLQVAVTFPGGGTPEFARLELRQVDADEDADLRNEFLMGGAGKVDGLAPGSWSVTARPGGFGGAEDARQATQVVEVVRGETLPLALELR